MDAKMEITEKEIERIGYVILDAYGDNELGGKYSKAFRLGVSAAYKRYNEAMKQFRIDKQKEKLVDEFLERHEETNRRWREALEQDEDWQHAKRNTMPYCNKGDSNDIQ